eukprot:gb/GECH01008620.1/.p1 GENE.gb/GECH01008620.1/~~gb/GECH01008620.1/.p1  ORF type:complete len:649 (+),score=206.66 gb/GECH01008620.1/:1-1947(+)
MSSTGEKRSAKHVDIDDESPAKRARTDDGTGKKKALLGKLLNMQSKVDSLIEPKQNGTQQTRKGRKGRGPRAGNKKQTKKSESSSPASRPKRTRKPARSLDSDFKLSWEYDACRKILKDIRSHNWSWPFLQPVDPDKLGLPDYFDIIKQPMDLGTIGKKLDGSEYENIEQFASDVRLVWNNCIAYNPPKSDVVAMAKTLQDIFEKRYKEVLEGKTQQQEPETSPKKPTRRKKAPEPAKPMTIEEKQELSSQIGDLSDDDLGKVVEIIQSRAPTSYSQSGGDEEVVVDLEQLDAATLRQIEKHVKTAVSKKKRKTKNSGRRTKSKKQSKPKSSKNNQQNKNQVKATSTTRTNTSTVDSQQTSGNGEPSTTSESGGKPSEVKQEKDKEKNESHEKQEDQAGQESDDELTDVSTASSSESDSGSDSSDSDTESKLLDPSAPRPLTLVLPDSSKPDASSSSSQKSALSFSLTPESKPLEPEDTNDEGEAPKIITSAHKPQEVKLKNAAAWSFADEPDSKPSSESNKSDTDATWSEFKSISQQREREQKEQQEKLRLQQQARKQQLEAEREKRKREIEQDAQQRKRQREEAEIKELKDREEARIKARREREKMAQNASADIDEADDENWDSLEFSQALSFEGFESKPEHLSDN